MLTFLTLFLGLVTGVQLVEFEVNDPAIVTVEITLDGQSVATLRGAPWRVPCDLGETLRPHELVASGRDQDGRELARIRQWINLPRDRAELELVPEPSGDGPARVVRLVWSSVDAGVPEHIDVRFDGRVIAGATAQHVALPDYDASQPHLLQVELVLGPTTVRAELVVGGGGHSETARELTALTLALQDGVKLPTVDDMRGWFTRAGEPLRVVAVERPGIDVVLVQDLDWGLQGQLQQVRDEILAPRTSMHNRPTGLTSRDEFRLLFPLPQATLDARAPSAQFPVSPDLWRGQEVETFSTGAGSRQLAAPLPQGLLVGLPASPERRIDTSTQALTDATATAALVASAGRRGRAVILVAGSEVADHSRFDPAEVRRYLTDLGVPLFVWSPRPELVAPAWGPVERIGNRVELIRAIRNFRTELDRQVLVWVEGRHLPHEVTLSTGATRHLASITNGSSPAPTAAETLTTVAVAAPASPEPTAAATEPTATFAAAAEVRLVNVDVVATHPDGTVATDLTRDDFILREDGQPVEIVGFEAPASATQPEVASDQRATGGSTPTLAVYLDLTTLDPGRRRQTFDALEAALVRDADQPRRTLIAVHDRTTRVVLPATTDAAAVRAALELLRNLPVSARHDEAQQLFNEMGRVQEALESAHRLRDPIEREMEVHSALSRRTAVEAMLPALAEQRRDAVRELLGSLATFLDALAGLSGQRTLLYVGSRLVTNPAEDLYSEAGRSMVDSSSLALQITGMAEENRQAVLLNEAQRGNLLRDIEALVGRANVANVTLSTLVPASLAGGDAAWRSTAGSPGARGRLDADRDASSKVAACQLADGTGGRCEVGGTDVDAALAATVDDLAATYRLAFTPNRPADGTDHRLEVVTNRPNLHLRYRSSYRDHAQVPPSATLLAALLLGDSNPEPLDLELAVVGQTPGPRPDVVLVELAVHLPLANLTLLPATNPDRRVANLKLLVATRDDQGRSAGIQEFPMGFTVTGNLDAPVPARYTHTVRLSLKPGQHTVAIGVWDEVAGIGATERVEVEVGPRD